MEAQLSGEINPFFITNSMIRGDKAVERSSEKGKNSSFMENKNKIIFVAANVFAFIANPIFYGTGFLVGVVLNAANEQTAEKISNFITKSRKNKILVSYFVGLLAVGFAPARCLFAATNAFETGRLVQEKLAALKDSFCSKKKKINGSNEDSMVFEENREILKENNSDKSETK